MKIFDSDSFQEIWATITRNKFRSVATGFGVFWGLFMLIVLIATGTKLQHGIIGQLDGFASNSVMFEPNRTTEAYKGYRKGRYWQFRNRDLNLIRQKARSVDKISPMLWGGGGDKNVVRGNKSASYRFQSCYPEHFEIETMHWLKGRNFNGEDIKGRRKVCVIGKVVYETLFEPGEDPLGQFIRVNGIYFQVVGVVSPRSNGSVGGNVEEKIYFPFTTHQMLFSRNENFWFLTCTAKPGYSASEVEVEVRNILKQAHDISPTDDNAMWTMNIENTFKMMNSLFAGVNFLMWIVGLGALFSGIIGISNIMLVTVRERMREIGVRRALGAKPANIIIQIMSESFLLTAMAGMLGFMLGVAVSLGIEKIPMGSVGSNVVISTEPIVPFDVALMAMLVLVVSGIVAGLLPAWRALKVKAIDAIRDE